MKPEQLQALNQEMKALLDKYNVVLAIEDVPATQKVVVKLREQPVNETATEQNTSEVGKES